MNDAEIIVGVTGGVAAFKTAALVSRLVQQGRSVQVVMTPAAHQFIGPATFAALTNRPTVTDLFDPRFPLGAHIELARQARLLCVAPATANFLAQAAHGMASDLLSTLYLCFQGDVLLAPAMNCEMWQAAATQRNVRQLEKDGAHLISPGTGWLSCRTQGVGRMAEPDEIEQDILALLEQNRR